MSGSHDPHNVRVPIHRQCCGMFIYFSAGGLCSLLSPAGNCFLASPRDGLDDCVALKRDGLARFALFFGRASYPAGYFATLSCLKGRRFRLVPGSAQSPVSFFVCTVR